MAKKDTEFMYASAKVGALETKLLTREKYAQIIDAPAMSEAVAVLSESMTPIYSGGVFDLEATVDRSLADSFMQYKEMLGGEKLFDFLQYEFDANNIKALIKAHFAGGSADSMLFECGTVSCEEAKRGMAEMDFSAYPENLKKAAAEAISAYRSTGDPRRIDIAVDNAAFADMLACVKDEEWLTSFIKLRIDMINVITAIRFVTFPPAVRESLFVYGGNISKEDFPFEGNGRMGLAETLASGGFECAGIFSEGKFSFAELEYAADMLLLGKLRDVRFVPFGVVPLFAYLYMLKLQAKNLRIIFALRAANADKNEIRSRLRIMA